MGAFASLTEVPSDRLVGFQPSREDVRELHAIYSALEVARWVSASGRPETLRDIGKRVSRDRRHWHANGIGRWYWREKDTGDLVARCGPRLTVVCGDPEVEFHWAVRPDRQGRGYASEAAAAAVKACSKIVSVNSVVAYAHVDNVASLGVMSRAWFLFERTFDFNDRPHVLHRRMSPQASHSPFSSHPVAVADLRAERAL